MSNQNRIVVVTPNTYSSDDAVMEDITVDRQLDDGFWGFISPANVASTLLKLPLDEGVPFAAITADANEVPESKLTTVPSIQGVLSTQIDSLQTFISTLHVVEVYAPELSEPELSKVITTSTCKALSLTAEEATLQKTMDDAGKERPVLTLRLSGNSTSKTIHEVIAKHLGDVGSIFSRSTILASDGSELFEERLSSADVAEAALFFVLASPNAIRSSLTEAQNHSSISDYLLATSYEASNEK